MDRVWNTRKGFLGEEVVRAREMATVEGIMTGTTPKHRREARISCSDFADCRGLGSGPIRESLITPELCWGVSNADLPYADTIRGHCSV